MTAGQADLFCFRAVRTPSRAAGRASRPASPVHLDAAAHRFLSVPYFPSGALSTISRLYPCDNLLSATRAGIVLREKSKRNR